MKVWQSKPNSEYEHILQKHWKRLTRWISERGDEMLWAKDAKMRNERKCNSLGNTMESGVLVIM
jgi:hypothetical protein